MTPIRYHRRVSADYPHRNNMMPPAMKEIGMAKYCKRHRQHIKGWIGWKYVSTSKLVIERMRLAGWRMAVRRRAA